MDFLRNKTRYFLMFFLGSCSFFIEAPAQSLVKQEGFWFGDQHVSAESILIEAFFDPVCPDTRDSWPPLRTALKHYGSAVALVVYTFPLPYHDNAFVSSRALHVVNKLNASATYIVLEKLFKHQVDQTVIDLDYSESCLPEYSKQMNQFTVNNSSICRGLVSSGRTRYYKLIKKKSFYGAATFNTSRSTVEDKMVKFVVDALGTWYHSSIKSGFTDPKTDHATRVSFKYGCIRGVYGTPFFFVNGLPLTDVGSTLSYEEWRRIIDPLVGKYGRRSEDSGHSSE